MRAPGDRIGEEAPGGRPDAPALRPSERVPVADPPADPRYDEGARLFSAGDWFEAHEVWEDLWRDDPSDGREFYQGLIMAAVALEHWRRGNGRGARSQWTKARERLARFPDHHARLDVKGFIAAMDTAMAPIVSHSEAHWQGGNKVPPLLRANAPRVVLEPRESGP